MVFEPNLKRTLWPLCEKKTVSLLLRMMSTKILFWTCGYRNPLNTHNISTKEEACSFHHLKAVVPTYCYDSKFTRKGNQSPFFLKKCDFKKILYYWITFSHNEINFISWKQCQLSASWSLFLEKMYLCRKTCVFCSIFTWKILENNAFWVENFFLLWPTNEKNWSNAGMSARLNFPII